MNIKKIIHYSIIWLSIALVWFISPLLRWAVFEREEIQGKTASKGFIVMRFGGFILFRDLTCTSQDGVRVCGPDYG